MAPKTEMSAKAIRQFAEERVAGLNGRERGWLMDALKRGGEKRRKDAMKLLAELECSENLSLKRKRKLVADIRRLEEEAQRMELQAASPAVQINIVDSKGEKIEQF